MASEVDWDAVLRETRSHHREFVGLSELEAQALAERLGLELRVVPPDGAVSADLRPRRMTVALAGGRVTKAFGG